MPKRLLIAVGFLLVQKNALVVDAHGKDYLLRVDFVEIACDSGLSADDCLKSMTAIAVDLTVEPGVVFYEKKRASLHELEFMGKIEGIDNNMLRISDCTLQCDIHDEFGEPSRMTRTSTEGTYAVNHLHRLCGSAWTRTLADGTSRRWGSAFFITVLEWPDDAQRQRKIVASFERHRAEMVKEEILEFREREAAKEKARASMLAQIRSHLVAGETRAAARLMGIARQHFFRSDAPDDVDQLQQQIDQALPERAHRRHLDETEQ